jgi:colicin import membrane protein
MLKRNISRIQNLTPSQDAFNWRAFSIALAIHVGLAVLLFANWNLKIENAGPLQVELWADGTPDAVPPPEPEPTPETPQPVVPVEPSPIEPQPAPPEPVVPTPPPPPPPAPPDLAVNKPVEPVVDPDIALEEDRKKKAEEKRQLQAAETARLAQEKIEQARLEKIKQEKALAEKERQDQELAKQREDQAKLEKIKQEELKLAQQKAAAQAKAEQAAKKEAEAKAQAIEEAKKEAVAKAQAAEAAKKEAQAQAKAAELEKKEAEAKERAVAKAKQEAEAKAQAAEAAKQAAAAQAKAAAAKKAAADKALKEAFRRDVMGATGIPGGTASSNQSGGGSDSGYAGKVRACVKPGVSFPSPIRSGDTNPFAEFRVQLKSDGVVSSTTLTKPSGNTSFDRAVEAGIKRCTPFPAPPSGRYPSYIDVTYYMYD